MALKNLHVTPKLPTYFRIGHKIRTYYMGGPKQMLWNIFCTLVRPHFAKSIRIRSYSGPNFFRIFPRSDWIRRDTPYLSVISSDAGKYGKNANQNNSGYRHFLRSAKYTRASQPAGKMLSSSNLNTQNSVVLLTFSDFDCKYRFWVNLVRNIKIVSLFWNLVPGLIRICRIQWRCSIFLLFIGITLKIWSN